MATANTIRTGTLGKHALRLVEQNGRFFGLADGKVCVEGEDADQVWQGLHDDAGKSDPKYFGYSGGRNRFLKFFPDGFQSDLYASGERTYKLDAKSRLDETAPIEEALSGTGLGEAVLAVYRATNMLSPFEKTKLQDVLRGKDADAVIQALAEFATEPSQTILGQLEALLRKYESAKWTVITYLPFLWMPDRHMFLKPDTTKDYATRVGHPFASIYSAKLNLEIYDSLLDLVDRTGQELSDLEPRDRVDIQSFIWVVGNYQDDELDA